MRRRGQQLTRCVAAVAVVGAMALGVAASPLGATEGSSEESPLAEVTVVRFGGADRFETSVLTTKAFTDFKGDHLEQVMIVSGYKWQDAVVAAPFDSPVLLTRRHEVPAATMDFLRRFDAPWPTVISTKAIAPAVDQQLRDAGLDVHRVEGSDQFRTSVAVADFFGTVGQYKGRRTVILASGQVFADALVAGQLSARENLPILLTPPNSLHSTVRELLISDDVQQVIIMGGAAAVSERVEESIEKLGIDVLRFAGKTRFETAVHTAHVTRPVRCWRDGEGIAVGLTRAWVPYDAFSAAPMLARYGAPLLLTNRDELPQATVDYLDEVRAAQAKCGDAPVKLIVIGGEAAVSQAAIDAYLQRDPNLKE